MYRQAIAAVAAIIARSLLIRRSSTMLAGVVGSKAAGVLALLLLARLYDADAFGLLGLLQAMVMMILAMSTLGYQYAIVLPNRDADAAAVAWLSLGVVAGTTLMAATVVATLHSPIARALEAPALASLLYWAPPLLLTLGVYEVMVYWLTRRQAFNRVARSRVALTIAVAGAQISAWYLGASIGGLVYGLVLGTGTAVAAYAFQTWYTDRARLCTGLSWIRLGKMARVYRRFPLYQAPASALSSVSLSAIPLGIGYFFGPAVVGAYWVADRVCGYLANLVYQSMQQVFLQRASEVARSPAEALRLFRRTTLGLFVLGLPLALLIVAAGPSVFGLAFGSDWIEAGVLARWLAVAWLFALLNMPPVQLAAIYNLQRWTLWCSFGLAASRGVGIAVGGVMGDPIIVVMIYAVGNATCNMVFLAAMDRYVRRQRVGHSACTVGSR